MALLPISRSTATSLESRECGHSATARSTAATTNLWGSTSAAGKNYTAACNGARSCFAAGTIYATDANTTGANSLPHTTAGHTANHGVNDSFNFFKYSSKNLGGWWNLKHYYYYIVINYYNIIITFTLLFVVVVLVVSSV